MQPIQRTRRRLDCDSRGRRARARFRPDGFRNLIYDANVSENYYIQFAATTLASLSLSSSLNFSPSPSITSRLMKMHARAKTRNYYHPDMRDAVVECIYPPSTELLLATAEAAAPIDINQNVYI